MINKMVQHSMKPYRDRVECFIFQNDKLMVGSPPGWNGYVIPGGGVDTAESMIEAIKREVLEELGVEIHNIERITDKPTIINYDMNSTHDYASKWKGIRIVTYKAEYLKVNRSLYGKAGDKYSVNIIHMNKAITFFEKHAAHMKKVNDAYNYNKATETAKILHRLKSR